jgi:hypothetical protein
MKRVSLLGGILAVLALPSMAVAHTRKAAADSAGALPFTGLDVVLLIAGVSTLVAAGLVIHQVSRRLDRGN